MPSVNRVYLVGNVTADTPLKLTKKGKKVANFTIATNEQWKTGEGEIVKSASFHNAVAWNGLADFASRVCNKGRLMHIEGKIIYRDYEDKEGNKRKATEILVNTIKPMDYKKNPPEAEELPTEDVEVEEVKEKELVAA